MSSTNMKLLSEATEAEINAEIDRRRRDAQQRTHIALRAIGYLGAHTGAKAQTVLGVQFMTDRGIIIVNGDNVVLDSGDVRDFLPFRSNESEQLMRICVRQLNSMCEYALTSVDSAVGEEKTSGVFVTQFSSENGK